VNLISSYNSTVILICLLYVIITGLYTSRKVASSGSLYFYADKASTARESILSLFSLHFPGEYFLGVMLIGFSLWWAAYPAESVCLLVYMLAMYFIFPRIMEEKFTVLQEEFEARFGKKIKLIVSSITIVTGIFFRLSLIIITAGILFGDILGWNLTTFILLMVLASGIYSVAGGFVSFNNLQLFQFILLIIAFILVLLFGIKNNAVLLISGTSDISFNGAGYEFIKKINLAELFLVIPVVSLWYWYNEYSSAKRFFPASETKTLKKQLSYSRIIKAGSLLFFFLLGISSRSLSPETRQENILSAIMGNEGLNIAVRMVLLFFIFSITIHSIASVFISASTQLAKDFLEPKYGQSCNYKLILYCRFFISILVIITIFVVPFTDIREISSYINIFCWQLYLLAPVAAIYTSMLFKEKVSSGGIIIPLITGELLALIYILINLYLKSKPVQGDIMQWLGSVSALQITLSLYLICIMLVIIVSRINLVSTIQFNNLFRKV
jgi:Na+/proline symporter